MTPRRLHHTELVRATPETIVERRRLPLTVVVDNVRSLYNVGSLFRTCDGALVGELVLCGYTPHPPRREIEKTALGATASVPWRYERDAAGALRLLKDAGWRIAALEQTADARSMFDVTAGDFPLVLVVGNEIEGVSDAALALCDDSFELPMAGIKHSLNVAVAAGIAIYECARVLGLNGDGPG